MGDIRTGEDKQIFEESKRSTPNTQMIITGFVTQQDLPVYYALMDVVLQPSLRGGPPNTLLEALTCEKAVIATSVGGIIDVVADCQNGRIVSTNNITGLVNVIDKLLANEDL